MIRYAMVIFVFCSSVALAQTAPPQPAPMPRAANPLSVGSLDPLIGTWEGSGKLARTGAAVGSITSFEKRINGDTIFVVHRERAPNTYEYNALISFDSVTGELVMLMASNNKNGGRLLRSSGWQGDKLVFTADHALHAWFAEEKLTFERQGPDQITATYEMSRDKGATWRVGDTQVYKRVPAGG